MSEKLSIIIPTYNGEKYIEKTIDSCLSQTYDNIEIFVIDDCSSDNTVGLLEKYSTKITLIINEKNQGLAKNVNKCVKIVSGKYVMLLGHDDTLDEKHVEIMMNELVNDISFIHCNSCKIDSEGHELGIAVSDKAQIIKNLFPRIFLSISNYIHSTGTIISRDKYLSVGGWDERFTNYGEWLFWIKAANVGKIKYTCKTRAYYRRHDTNMTNSFQTNAVKKKLEPYFATCKLEAHSNLNILERFFVAVFGVLMQARRKML